MSVDFIYMTLLYGLGSQFPTCRGFSLGIYLQKKKKLNSQAALCDLICINYVSVVPCAALVQPQVSTAGRDTSGGRHPFHLRA